MIESGKLVVLQVVMKSPVGVDDVKAQAMAQAGVSISSHLLPFVVNVGTQMVADETVKPPLGLV